MEQADGQLGRQACPRPAVRGRPRQPRRFTGRERGIDRDPAEDRRLRQGPRHEPHVRQLPGRLGTGRRGRRRAGIGGVRAHRPVQRPPARGGRQGTDPSVAHRPHVNRRDDIPSFWVARASRTRAASARPGSRFGTRSVLCSASPPATASPTARTRWSSPACAATARLRAAPAHGHRRFHRLGAAGRPVLRRPGLHRRRRGTTSRGVAAGGAAFVGFNAYCHSGRTTGEHCGHTATSTNAQVCTSTGCKSPVIQFTGGTMIQGGDSGGAFYAIDSAGKAWIRGNVIATNGTTGWASPSPPWPRRTASASSPADPPRRPAHWGVHPVCGPVGITAPPAATARRTPAVRDVVRGQNHPRIELVTTRRERPTRATRTTATTPWRAHSSSRRPPAPIGRRLRPAAAASRRPGHHEPGTRRQPAPRLPASLPG